MSPLVLMRGNSSARLGPGVAPNVVWLACPYAGVALGAATPDCTLQGGSVARCLGFKVFSTW